MIIALIALAAFVVLLSIQVYFAQTEITELKLNHKVLKEICFERIIKLESEVEENE
jgi:hypothetical protein